MSEFITTTDLAIVDPSFALLGGIRARQESLRREWAFCSQTTKRVIAKPMFVEKCIRALAHLRELEVRQRCSISSIMRQRCSATRAFAPLDLSSVITSCSHHEGLEYLLWPSMPKISCFCSVAVPNNLNSRRTIISSAACSATDFTSVKGMAFGPSAGRCSAWSRSEGKGWWVIGEVLSSRTSNSLRWANAHRFVQAP